MAAIGFVQPASLAALARSREFELDARAIEARLTRLRPDSPFAFCVGDRWINLEPHEARALRLRAGSGGERARLHAPGGSVETPEFNAVRKKRGRPRTRTDEQRRAARAAKSRRHHAKKRAAKQAQLEAERAKQVLP